jgi:uncharacterized repeat protein (TIGR02543 family)
MAFTVSTGLSDNRAGTVSPSQKAIWGTEITLTATANPGWTFTQWSDGNTNATRTVIVEKDITYTAIFEPIPITNLELFP